VHEQERERGALLGAAERQRLAARPDLEQAEEPKSSLFSARIAAEALDANRADPG
jgi:hypothetical protein